MRFDNKRAAPRRFERARQGDTRMEITSTVQCAAHVCPLRMVVSKPAAPGVWARGGTVSHKRTVASRGAHPSASVVARAILLFALLLSCGQSLAQINVAVSLRP